MLNMPCVGREKNKTGRIRSDSLCCGSNCYLPA